MSDTTRSNTQPDDAAGRRGADLDDPKADRPGGPGQGGQQVVAPGQVGPAAAPEGSPEHDQAVQDRREHLRKT